MKIVFDVDDTICKNGKQYGYDKAEPIQRTIDKINYLHKELGAEIILHTSRGMASCNGDAEKAKAKNETVLKEWLKTHNVHYDEIIFGKPLADLYVDDRGLALSDFWEKDFCRLKGGSGAKIYRLADIVVKEMKTPEEAEQIKRWAETSIVRHPKILGTVYEKLYMEYIDGELACDCLDTAVLEGILEDISKEAEQKYKSFDMQKHIEILEANRGIDNSIDKLIDICKYKLAGIEVQGSAGHGDMILSNIICKGGERYYIDPRPISGASSYMLDYAKLRMSISGYENKFHIGKGKDLRKWLGLFDYTLEKKGALKETKILELMYVLRLARYGKNDDKIINFAEGVLAEID